MTVTARCSYNLFPTHYVSLVYMIRIFLPKDVTSGGPVKRLSVNSKPTLRLEPSLGYQMTDRNPDPGHQPIMCERCVNNTNYFTYLTWVDNFIFFSARCLCCCCFANGRARSCYSSQQALSRVSVFCFYVDWRTPTPRVLNTFAGYATS